MIDGLTAQNTQDGLGPTIGCKRQRRDILRAYKNTALLGPHLRTEQTDTGCSVSTFMAPLQLP